MPMPTKAGWYWWLCPDASDNVVVCVRQARGGLFADSPLLMYVADCEPFSTGTWGARIPEDATLKAMREMRDVDPWVTDPFSAEGGAGRSATHHEPGRECRYCECEYGYGHAPDCPWLRAQEDET